jgi:hypothetical protein
VEVFGGHRGLVNSVFGAHFSSSKTTFLRGKLETPHVVSYYFNNRSGRKKPRQLSEEVGQRMSNLPWQNGGMKIAQKQFKHINPERLT